MPHILALRSADVNQALTMLVVGMLVVFAALILVGLVMFALRTLLAERPGAASGGAGKKPQRPGEPAPAAPPTPSASRPEALDPKTLAVISAAATAAVSMARAPDRRTLAILTASAAAAVGRPVRVRRVGFLRQSVRGGWAERGRQAIHSSHNLQQRNR